MLMQERVSRQGTFHRIYPFFVASTVGFVIDPHHGRSESKR